MLSILLSLLFVMPVFAVAEIDNSSLKWLKFHAESINTDVKKIHCPVGSEIPLIHIPELSPSSDIETFSVLVDQVLRALGKLKRPLGEAQKYAAYMIFVHLDTYPFGTKVLLSRENKFDALTHDQNEPLKRAIDRSVFRTDKSYALAAMLEARFFHEDIRTIADATVINELMMGFYRALELLLLDRAFTVEQIEVLEEILKKLIGYNNMHYQNLEAKFRPFLEAKRAEAIKIK
jgi:hypothetical protein